MVSTTIKVIICVIVVVLIGAYIMMRISSKHTTKPLSEKKDHESESNITKNIILKPSTSGHYYLQSISSGLFLDKNGVFQKDLADANSFYVNVDTNVVDPEPTVNVQALNAPGAQLFMYLTNNGGVFGVSAPGKPIFYLSIGKTNTGNLSLNSGDTFQSAEQIGSQTQYLFQFLPKQNV